MDTGANDAQEVFYKKNRRWFARNRLIVNNFYYYITCLATTNVYKLTETYFASLRQFQWVLLQLQNVTGIVIKCLTPMNTNYIITAFKDSIQHDRGNWH